MLDLAFFRVGLFGLNHAVFTGFTGIGFAMTRLSTRPFARLLAPILGFGVGVGLHAVHNGGIALIKHLATDENLALTVFLSVVATSWMGMMLVLTLAIWGLYRERGWITRHLWEEVESGLLPESVYHDCRSIWRRGAKRLLTLIRGDLKRWWQLGRLYHVAIELAFRKHQREELGEERWEPEIVRLRREMKGLIEAVFPTSQDFFGDLTKRSGWRRGGSKS